MTISITLNEAEAALVSEYAEKSQVSVAEFARAATTKAARNAEYLAMLDRGFKQMEEGGGRLVTKEEMERMLNE